MEKEKEEVLDNEAVENQQPLEEQPETTGQETSDADNVSADAPSADDKSAQMAAEAQQWQDKYVRLVAEFDNYRKRTQKEKMELKATGGEDVIKSLLVVLDDIDRAMAAMQTASDVESLKEGMALIHHKLMETLRAQGLEEIDAIGKELDTDLHEAVAKIPVDDPQKGKIVDVVQKGYKLKDKVIRYAKVVVGE